MLVEMTDIDGTTHYRVYREGKLVGLLAARSTRDARPANCPRCAGSDSTPQWRSRRLSCCASFRLPKWLVA